MAQLEEMYGDFFCLYQTFILLLTAQKICFENEYLIPNTDTMNDGVQKYRMMVNKLTNHLEYILYSKINIK